MKIVRTVGLAAVAALALVASLGAGSALATTTTLCETAADSPFCDSEDRYPANTNFYAETTKQVIKLGPSGWTDLGNIECTKETRLTVKASAGSGSPLPVSVPNWEFNECVSNLSHEGCGIYSSATAKGSLSWSSGSDGTLVSDSAAASVDMECPYLFFGEKCTYELEPAFVVEGGQPAQVQVTKTTMSLTEGDGFYCPSSPTLEAATYATSPTKALYVAREPLEDKFGRFCKVAESPCSSENTYPAGTTIVATNPNYTEFKIGFTVVGCGDASLTLKTTDTGVEPPLRMPFEIIEAPMQECSMSGVGDCEVTNPSLGMGDLYLLGGGDGSLRLAGPLWRFVCGNGSFDCTYGSVADGNFEGGNPASIVFTESDLAREPSCPVARLTTKFTVNSPKPLYFE